MNLSVFSKLFDDPGDAGFLAIYGDECSEVINPPTDVVQFSTYGKDFVFTSGFGLADGDDTFPLSNRIRWIAPSSTNGGGQGWGPIDVCWPATERAFSCY